MSMDIYDILDSYYSSVYDSTSVNTSSTTNSANSASDLKSFMTSIKELSGNLSKALNTLFANSGSIFNQMSATSGNTDFLSVVSDSKKLSASSAASYDISIKQLATSQKNTGAWLKSSASAVSNGFSTGNNQFSIDTNGKTYNLNVNISASDTVESAQKKVADAINKSGSGLTATVSTAKDGTSSLSVTSKTGDKNSFEFSGSNFITALNLNNKTSTAQDAMYSVNGSEWQYSDSNTVTISDGITATLKKATSGDDSVKVNVGKDTDSIVNAATDLVNSYNALMKEANSLKAAGNSSLARQLSGIASTYAASLEKAGITTGKDGMLSIDKKKLTSAAESGELQKALGFRTDGSSSMGFASKLEQLSNTANRDPSNYLSVADRTTLKNSEKSKYDPTSEMYSNQYLNFKDYNTMNQWLGIGSLFDQMF